jgi:hypothetical protein
MVQSSEWLKPLMVTGMVTLQIKQAIYADATSQDTAGGYGLDFGQFCGSASTSLASDQTTQIFF